MHVDFPTTYGFTWPINQIFKPCVTSEQETLRCCVVVPFIQRVPRWALLRRRRQPTVTKGVKGLARWRTAFSAPSCNGRIRASEEGRNHAKRARKESAASEPLKSPSTVYFIPSRSAVLPGSWKWNRTNISSVQKRGE